jgi:hypothetical protein
MSMRIATRRLLLPAAIAASAGLLVAGCGGSGAGLIPSASAGPLAHDFEEIGRLAKAGNGDCQATSEAIQKAESDFERVSAKLDLRLRANLQQGIRHLRGQAEEECSRVTTTSTTTTTKTHTETFAPVTTTTQSVTTAPQTTSAGGEGEESPNGGGTQAPGGENPNPGGAEAQGGQPGERGGGGGNGGGH